MITVLYGKDMANDTYELLKASDISNSLRAEYSVAVKPNLINAKPASLGSTTHPEVVDVHSCIKYDIFLSALRHV